MDPDLPIRITDRIIEAKPPYGWIFNPETGKQEPVYDPNFRNTAGPRPGSGETAEVYNRAHGLLLLNQLVEHPLVYQVNTFKQLSQYGVTITLKTRVKNKSHTWQKAHGLAAIGFPSTAEVHVPVAHEPERRTITAYGKSLVEALLHALAEFDTYNRIKKEEA